MDKEVVSAVFPYGRCVIEVVEGGLCASSGVAIADLGASSALQSARFYPPLDRLSDQFCRMLDRLSDQFTKHWVRALSAGITVPKRCFMSSGTSL